LWLLFWLPLPKFWFHALLELLSDCVCSCYLRRLAEGVMPISGETAPDQTW